MIQSSDSTADLTRANMPYRPPGDVVSISCSDDSVDDDSDDESYGHACKKPRTATMPDDCNSFSEDVLEFLTTVKDLTKIVPVGTTRSAVRPGLKMTMETASGPANVTAIEWRLWQASPLPYSDGLVLYHDTWFLEVQHESGELEYISEADAADMMKVSALRHARTPTTLPSASLIANPPPPVSPLAPRARQIPPPPPVFPLTPHPLVYQARPRPVALDGINDPQKHWQFSLDVAAKLQCKLNGDGWKPTHIDLVEISCRAAIRAQLAGMRMAGRRLDTMCAGTIDDIKAAPADYLNDDCAVCKTLARAYTALRLQTHNPIDDEHDMMVNIPLGRVVFPGAPADHLFSHLQIDNCISRFEPWSAEEDMVCRIYYALCYECMPAPCADGMFCILRQLCFTHPADPTCHGECLVFGSTQCMKTYTQTVVEWAGLFVDGTQPIQFIRNKAGGPGADSFVRAWTTLNLIIKNIFTRLHRNRLTTLGRNDYKKFQIQPRVASKHEYLEFGCDRLLTRPQALIACTNAAQIKALIAPPNAAQRKLGAYASVFDTFKGIGPSDSEPSPYPAKCRTPVGGARDGTNRMCARLTLIMDEDDLNRTQREGANQRMSYNASAAERRLLSRGLERPTEDAIDDETVESDDDETVESDDDEIPEVEEDPDDSDDSSDASEAVDDETVAMVSGIRSAAHNVVAFTATPFANGIDLTKLASQVVFNVVKMPLPSNYVGTDDRAMHKITWEEVPNRVSPAKAPTKTQVYKIVLDYHGLWDGHGQPPPPFTQTVNGVIKLPASARADFKVLTDEIDVLVKQLAPRRAGMAAVDGPGLCCMLRSMQVDVPGEDERRALVITNFTKNHSQKQAMASAILRGELGAQEDIARGVIVVVYHFDCLSIRFRAEDHELDDILDAMEGTMTIGDIFDHDGIWVINSSTVDIVPAYDVLMRYADQRRRIDPRFKLLTVTLAGEVSRDPQLG